MRKMLKITFVIISIAVGCLFLYSAYTKFDPIQPFEYTLVEHLGIPWQFAPVLARLLIGSEAALGALLVLHLFGKRKQVLKGALALVVILSIYLTWLWAKAGNNVNCGCFGDAIWMSPASSLIKNGILALFLGLLIKFHHGWENHRALQYGSYIIVASLVAAPFVAYPIPSAQPTWLRNDRYKMDLSDVNNALRAKSTAKPFSDQPADEITNVSDGKYVIAFVSQACEHCRIAARKMHVMKQNNAKLPFLLVIGGTESDLTDFWKKTGATDIPFTRLKAETFLQYTGGIFPTILWVNNSWVEAKADYNTLSQQQIENWLKQ